MPMPIQLPPAVVPLFDTDDANTNIATPPAAPGDSDDPPSAFTLPGNPRAARAALAELARAGTADALRHLREVVFDPDIPSQQRIQAAVALLNRGFADAERVSSVGIDINVSRVDPSTLSTVDIAARLRDIQTMLSHTSGPGPGRVIDVLSVDGDGDGAPPTPSRDVSSPSVSNDAASN